MEWWATQSEYAIEIEPRDMYVLSHKPEYCRTATVIRPFHFKQDALDRAYVLHLEADVERLKAEVANLKTRASAAYQDTVDRCGGGQV